MSDTADAGPARPGEIAQALALLDSVFLRARGREGTIAARYAPLFAANSPARLEVARHAGRVVAATVSRPFVLRTGTAAHAGSMVGFVATRPEHRGAGHASRLVGRAVEAARAQGSAFCVLWTTTPGFYRRLGWRAGDCGIACEAPALAGGSAPSPTEEVAQVEALAGHTLEMRVERDPSWYSVVPVSATRVRCFVTGPRGAPQAYAIVGESAGTRYVYELGGSDAGMLELFSRLRADGRNMVVNARQGDAFHRLSATAQDLAWRAQQLAMWLPLVPALDDIASRGWHVPWYDRI